MDIVLRRFLRMSMTLRNLAFSQAYRVNVPRLFSISISHLHKDKVNQSESKHCKEDLMLKILQHGLSPSKLLNYIDSNKNQIRGKHVLAALSSIHNFYQGKQQPNLHEHIDFTKLCTSLKPQIKQLTPSEALDALNMLHFFNVPSSNLFMTTLLQHIGEFMEELTVSDIYKLSVLIEKLSPTSLNESFNNDLQRYFSEKIVQVNDNDLIPSVHGFCFAHRHIQDEAILKFLSERVQNYGKELKQEKALETFLMLCSIQELPDELKKIIQQSQMLLLEKIDHLNPHQILQIIEGISYQINMKCDEFYNDTFIDDLIQKVISENWNCVQTSNILSCLNSIRHVQMELLDYMSAKFYEDPTILHTNLDLLQPLVMGLALADYKPVFWDVMREPILSNEISTPEDLKLCYFVLHLACLECFEPTLLQQVFSTKLIVSEEHQLILLKLYQIVKRLYPSYRGPWPSKDILDSFKSIQKSKSHLYPLLPAIEQAVGGNIYVKTNVRTTLEHYIDHVVIMNKNGYPIAVNSQQSIDSEHHNGIIYLEDLSIPPGSQIFLILYAQPEWYARNTRRMLGPYSLYIKTLESMSYTVIPVNGKMWQKIPDNEKTLYIMQAIKLKFEDDTISTTS